MMDRPKKVELKISLHADDVALARSRLDLTDGRASRATIWFCDRVRVEDERVRLVLFDRDVIVRLRRKREEDSDTTVKYRRPEPLTLPAGWDGDDADPDLEVEGDWTGERRQVSASLGSTVRGDVIDHAVAAGPPLGRRLFSTAQRRFASAVAAPGTVRLGSLVPLGPIEALRWQETRRSDLDEKLGAEQWTVDDQVFLELSMRVKYANAKKWQRRFTSWAVDEGFDVGAVQTTKTQAVLQHFARRFAG